MTSPEKFWTTIHERAAVVDRLPGYTPAMCDLLLDFLAVDYRISLPSSVSQRYPIAEPPAALLVGAFTRHDLRVLHTRIEKATLRRLPATSIFAGYRKSFTIESDFDEDWLGFLSRQSDHVNSDDEIVVILCGSGGVDRQ
ncbi:MAG: hypothetical protein DWQ34_28690 [Planctomycetota bacterium]|nr:MAG: hypothetical protein DWQ29_20995 [Planctomycetota bacterium]REJ85588.1 MAG: hypothetical protein DWQ34_28690 [Planctomycetota bacterium]REK26050.1 MAG: hypothetical protein DWQ41_10345 [Planctomycetota bacterium]REK31874.1 MAG: hypothetical protein DWQ45_18255 [Planctomycetota bacterium]